MKHCARDLGQLTEDASCEAPARGRTVSVSARGFVLGSVRIPLRIPWNGGHPLVQVHDMPGAILCVCEVEPMQLPNRVVGSVGCI